MSAVMIVLFMTVGLLSWENTTKRHELLEKHMFVYSKSFSFYDFQEIPGIIGNDIEIVGIKPTKKGCTYDTGITPAVKAVQQWRFFKKPKAF